MCSCFSCRSTWRSYWKGIFDAREGYTMMRTMYIAPNECDIVLQRVIDTRPCFLHPVYMLSGWMQPGSQKNESSSLSYDALQWKDLADLSRQLLISNWADSNYGRRHWLVVHYPVYSGMIRKLFQSCQILYCLCCVWCVTSNYYMML